MQIQEDHKRRWPGVRRGERGDKIVLEAGQRWVKEEHHLEHSDLQ